LYARSVVPMMQSHIFTGCDARILNIQMWIKGARGTYGEKAHTRFRWGKLKETATWKGVSYGRRRRMILK